MEKCFILRTGRYVQAAAVTAAAGEEERRKRPAGSHLGQTLPAHPRPSRPETEKHHMHRQHT